MKLFSEANTGYFYTWKKNPKAYPWRIAMRKYDPIVRQHVLFKVRRFPAEPPLPSACTQAAPARQAAAGPFAVAACGLSIWAAYLSLCRNARAGS